MELQPSRLLVLLIIFNWMTCMMIEHFAALEINLPSVFDKMARESVSVDLISTLSESSVPLEVSMPRIWALPHFMLGDARRSEEKTSLHSNDRWVARRADSLQKCLGWDMTVSLENLPLQQFDELPSNLFT